MMDDTELVVEVAMGDNKREMEHVEKHVEAGFDTIWIACPNEDVRNGLKKRLEDHGLQETVVFKRLAAFLNPEQAVDTVESAGS